MGMGGLVLALAGSLAPFAANLPPVAISRDQGSVSIRTGVYSWRLSTTAFELTGAGFVGQRQCLWPGRSAVDFLGSPVAFGPPEETRTGQDWVEFRGWIDRSKHLWYVARLQFFPGRPFCRLVLSLTDRHEPLEPPKYLAWIEPFAGGRIDRVTGGRLGRWVARKSLSGHPQEDPYWQDRLISNWTLEVGVPGGQPTSITQHNSYSGSVSGEPWVEVVGVSGSPWQWTPQAGAEGRRMRLGHGASPDGAGNRVTWHPLFEGRASLTASFTGLEPSEAYKAAKEVTYEITEASGLPRTIVVDQGTGPQAVPLGTLELSRSSRVSLQATGKGVALAGSLVVVPTSGAPRFEVAIGARPPGLISDGTVTLAVKDFWQHHPISLIRTGGTVGWRAMETPEILAGGMGLTLETLVAMEGTPEEALSALYGAPLREVPPSMIGRLGGSLAGGELGARYDALLREFATRLPRDRERLDSFGWRNWGDYQIGMSYATGERRFQDWANLQYDLPYGLLMAWLRTGDPELWRYAQASVRHLMDIDYVKFSPYPEKLNNLVRRKGEMPVETAHTASEPVITQAAFRSLLLYHYLTGEEWARDLAKENIDRLAFYGRTRLAFASSGDRSTAWVLRGVLAGQQHFPGASGEDYRGIADSIVARLLESYRAKGRLPGAQPVWQGQMVEGLAQYHESSPRPEVAEAIVGHVRYLLRDAIRSRADGSYEFLYCRPDEGDVCAAPQWSDEYNYAFLWLGSIAYAHRLSRDPALATWADRLFRYGADHLHNEFGTRPWTSLLSFPFLYLDVFGERRESP